MKKIICISVVLLLSFAVFAEPKSTGLTDKDVKNWAKNQNAIQAEFDDAGLNSEEIVAATKKQKVLAETILKKYGISEPNVIEKYAMISSCAALLMAENGMGGLDAASLAMMRSFGIDPLQQIKANINSQDLKVVRSNSTLVLQAADDYAESLPDTEEEVAETEYEEYSPLAQHRALSMQYSQPAIDNINKASTPVKNVYEYLTTGKKAGSGKLLYPVYDKDNASKYKKQAIDSKQLPLQINCYDFQCEDLVEDYSGVDEQPISVHAAINLNKKTAVFDVRWVEAEFEEQFDVTFGLTPIKTNYINKTVETKIQSVDYYYAKLGEKYSGSFSKEFVITTKEGAVIHLWYNKSDDGNAYLSEVRFGDIEAPEDTNWYEDNGY